MGSPQQNEIDPRKMISASFCGNRPARIGDLPETPVVSDQSAQGRHGAVRLGQPAHRHPGQAGRDPRQRAGQVRGVQQLAWLPAIGREVQEHQLGIDLGQAPREFLRAGQLLGQQRGVSQGLGQLRADTAVVGAEKKTAAALLQREPFASVCFHGSHREKPGICWPASGPIR